MFYKSPPNDLKKTFSDYACVAAILRPTTQGLELAFIRRAHNPNDPWAGQIAFPGGRQEKSDLDDLATALRETKEEVGWDLTAENFLGYLTDIQARNRTGVLNFFLRPLVFKIHEQMPLDQFDPEEVDETFWISLEHLRDIRHRTYITIPNRGYDLPAIKLPNNDTLWGLTYMVTEELLTLLKQTAQT